MKAKARRNGAPPVRYITDKGKAVEVVMKIADYQAMLERMEDLEDSVDFLESKRTAKKFVTLEQFKKDLAARRKP